MARSESRTARQERLRREAARTRLPEAADVVVVGGGAAGLVAAITAAEAQASVVVLERDLACGRSILATGNGRCNFANERLEGRRFNDPSFVEGVCGPHWLDDVLAFFRASGLRWYAEEGRLYPLSRQAASVRNVLLSRARRAGVVLAAAREASGITWHADGSADIRCVLTTGASKEQRIRAGAIVLATGGTDQRLLDDTSLHATPARPVLCPLACQDSPLFSLDGRRAPVQASLTRAQASSPTWSERGEVLVRSWGISGIVTFDLSRRAQAGDLVELDLAPDLTSSELHQLVSPDGRGGFESGCLDGILDPVLAALLERLARRRWTLPWPGHDEPDNDTQALLSLVKGFPLVVTGPAQTERAQVMRGGLCTDQFDPQSLATRGRPRLLACGETLDVDGDCGGFNLGWAWKSGMVAGMSAARAATHA